MPASTCTELEPAAELRQPAPRIRNLASNIAALACLCGALSLGITGCKSAAPATDAALTTSIQNTLSGDTSLAGQPVQAAVQAGVVTLSGTVANDAQRTIAARDAAGVAGIKEVINNLTVGAAPATASVTALPPPLPPLAPVPAAPASKITPKAKPGPQEPPHQSAPIERRQEAYNNPPPPQPQPQPMAPPPPPPPSFKTVTVPAGSTLPVRITQTLDSATTLQGASFSGVVASDLVIDGVVAIPAGSPVSGQVDAVQEAAHFKGSSLLTVSLASITRRGEHMSLTSDPYTVKGKGRGTNTVEKTAGGAAVGAILGGIFGGGKGAAIGAAAGGGVGAGSNAVTKGQQVQIESESVVRFHTSSPITVKVRVDAAERRPDEIPGLQPRSNL